MTDIKPIETYYNSYRFRSRLEARWALFFDLIGVKYEYEPEGLVLSRGGYYLPDFYLPQFHCYFEVKRAGIKGTPEGDEAIEKISDGMHSDTWAGLIAFGDPYDHDMVIFCQETNDSSGGSYQGPVVIGYSPGTREPMLFSWNDTRERKFFNSFTDFERIPMTTDVNLQYLENPFVTGYIIEAEKFARQSRFEHGEKPVLRRN